MTPVRSHLVMSMTAIVLAFSHAAAAQTSIAPGTAPASVRQMPAATAMPSRAPASPAVMPPPASPQVDATFAAWDADHNGSLSLAEFRRGATGLRSSAAEKRLQAQFSAVDANKNGAIDATEYGNLLLVKRAGAAAPPLSTFDGNRDQKLNFAEYTDLVRRLAQIPAANRPAPAAGK